MLKIRLIKVDFRKAQRLQRSVKVGDKAGRYIVPDSLISTKKTYLAKIFGAWCAGTFYREWYGLNFTRTYDVTVGHQLVSSFRGTDGWQALYEIKEIKIRR